MVLVRRGTFRRAHKHVIETQYEFNIDLSFSINFSCQVSYILHIAVTLVYIILTVASCVRVAELLFQQISAQRDS
jgi:hypothetical protein